MGEGGELLLSKRGWRGWVAFSLCWLGIDWLDVKMDEVLVE